MANEPTTPALASLYQELILEHYRHPRNQGELPEADVDIRMNNPTCGDDVHLQLHVEGGTIRDVKFTGTGCSISQASISMMTQLLAGRTPEEARGLAERFTEMMRGDAEAARDRSLGDLRALSGVSAYPVRVKCALLGWNALTEGLRRLTDDARQE